MGPEMGPKRASHARLEAIQATTIPIDVVGCCPRRAAAMAAPSWRAGPNCRLFWKSTGTRQGPPRTSTSDVEAEAEATEAPSRLERINGLLLARHVSRFDCWPHPFAEYAPGDLRGGGRIGDLDDRSPSAGDRPSAAIRILSMVASRERRFRRSIRLDTPRLYMTPTSGTSMGMARAPTPGSISLRHVA